MSGWDVLAYSEQKNQFLTAAVRTPWCRRFRRRTPAEAAQWLRACGVSITEFARRHRVSRDTVVGLLRGKNKGKRGDSHRAAVALGLKPAPSGSAPINLSEDSHEHESI